MEDFQSQGTTPIPVIVQNEPVLGQMMKSFNDKLSNVTTLLTSQGLKNLVNTFDGDPKNFSEWIKSIEKYCRLTGLELNSCKTLAFQSSSGYVSSFIERYMNSFPDSNWGDMKNELAKRFDTISDAACAMAILRTLKQKQNENTQVFAERIMSLAERAYDSLDNHVVQNQLIDIFVTGLFQESLKITILRKKPETLEHALNIALDELNLRQRIGMSIHRDSNTVSRQSNRGATNTDHEPMDVSHMRKLKCYKCGRLGHTIRNCRVKIQSVDRSIVCWGCGLEGHILRNCLITQRPTFSRPTKGHFKTFQKPRSRTDQPSKEN